MTLSPATGLPCNVLVPSRSMPSPLTSLHGALRVLFLSLALASTRHIPPGLVTHWASLRRTPHVTLTMRSAHSLRGLAEQSVVSPSRSLPRAISVLGASDRLKSTPMQAHHVKMSGASIIADIREYIKYMICHRTFTGYWSITISQPYQYCTFIIL